MFKITFSLPIPLALNGSNRTSHLETNITQCLPEQTMVPFQPVPSRQAKGQPSNSGPYRSFNSLHSFNAPKSSSVLSDARKRVKLWLETTDKAKRKAGRPTRLPLVRKKILSLFLELFTPLVNRNAKITLLALRITFLWQLVRNCLNLFSLKHVLSNYFHKTYHDI